MDSDKLLKAFRRLPESDAVAFLGNSKHPLVRAKKLQIIYARPWTKKSWSILLTLFFFDDTTAISLKVPILREVLSRRRFIFEIEAYKQKFPEHRELIAYYCRVYKKKIDQPQGSVSLTKSIA